MKPLFGECIHYLKGKVTIDIGLPEKELGCKHCPLCQKNYAMDSYYCIATGEILFKENMRNRIGALCPVEWEGGDGTDNHLSEIV